MRVEMPVAGLVAETTWLSSGPSVVKPTVVSEVARIFDEAVIRSFLGSKPALVIAVGVAAHQPQADALARELTAKGIPTTVTAEAQVFRRAMYPRVWNPYARLCKPGGDEKPSTNVQQRVELQLDDDGRTRAMTPDGKDLGAEWQKPNTLATVVGKGYVDWSGDSEICYEPVCKLLVEEGNRIRIVHGEIDRGQNDFGISRALDPGPGRPWVPTMAAIKCSRSCRKRMRSIRIWCFSVTARRANWWRRCKPVNC